MPAACLFCADLITATLTPFTKGAVRMPDIDYLDFDLLKEIQ